MDYEKKYKDALGWMKKVYPTMTGATREDAEHYFPELVENEDERIRRWLIGYFKQYINDDMPTTFGNGLKVSDVLAWLEKQCGQNHVNIPKFHEGDWIVHHGTENIYQVVAIIDNQYQLKYGDNYTVQKCADVDKCARLWDITKDAKDGDVLADNGTKIIFIFKNTEYDSYIESKVIKYFIRYSFDGINLPLENGGHLGVVGEYSNFVPATKEQRDLLFQKMKDAGYKWDADKKELKKIKDKPLVIDEGKDEIDRNFTEMMLKDNTKQKPVPNWRPIDAEYMNKLCEIIDEYDAETTTKCCWKNWLKSLKDRVWSLQERSYEELIKVADKYYDEVLIGQCKMDEETAHHCRLAYLQGLQLYKLKEE